MFINLSGKWKISDGEHEITGNVPGDVTNDAFLAGLVPDPYFGENWKDCLWVTQRDWIYERDFFLDVLPSEGDVSYIRFNGIDTYADVFLNGKQIGCAESMQRAYEFPADGALKEGANKLTVRLYNVFDKIGREDQQKYGSIFHANRIFARKAQCHFGWDWAPQFPGYGIFRDVAFVCEPACALKEVNIRPYLSGDVTFRLLFGEKFEGGLAIVISRNGVEVARFEEKINAKKMICNLRVQNPSLWWPNGYGEQALYDYEILQTKNGNTVFTKKGYFGFREVALNKRILDGKNLDFAVEINNRPVYCRGSNWVPAECMTGRLTDEKYDKLLVAAKRANYNMLRVWGGGIYESDRFYENCDRMGIMIWQDFMFACSEIPEEEPDFIKKLTEETVLQVKRLKNHPCLTYWCGMNEITGSFSEADERYSYFTLHYLFRGIVGEHSEEIPYGYSSPFAFADTENDAFEGDVHANISEPCLFNASFKGFEKFEYGEQLSDSEAAERICRYDDCLGTTDGNFSSECAVLGACNYASLVRFTPESERNLQSDFFKQRFLGNPYTYVMPTFYERQTLLASSMYGAPTNLKDFVKKVNKSQLDIMTSEIVFARSNGRSHGLLTWMYNDIWPTGTWSVVDYYLTEKPAYYAMKRCYKPLMAEIIRVRGEHVLCLANDTQKPFEAQFDIFLCDYNGKTAKEIGLNVSLGAGERAQKKLAIEGDPDGYIYFRYSTKDKANAGEGVYWTGRYNKTPFRPEYAVEVSEKGGETLLTVSARTFVPCFAIFTERNAELSDNYFDLRAGAKKTVTVRGATGECITFADFYKDWNA